MACIEFKEFPLRKVGKNTHKYNKCCCFTKLAQLSFELNIDKIEITTMHEVGNVIGQNINKVENKFK